MTDVARDTDVLSRVLPSEVESLEPKAQAQPVNDGGPPSGTRLSIPRLAITRIAPRVFRLHAARSATRVGVLLAGDVSTILVLRALLVWARDYDGFGPAVGAFLRGALPASLLHGPGALLALLVGLTILDTYGASDRRRDTARIVAGASLGLLLPFWGYFATDFGMPALGVLLAMIVATGCALVVERHLIDEAVRTLWPVGPGAARALLLGNPSETNRALEHPALSDTREFVIVGALDPAEVEQDGKRLGLERLCETIRGYRADTVVLVGSMDDDAFAGVIDAAGAAGCQAFALTRSYMLAGVEPRVIWKRGAPLVALTRPALRGRQLLLKRSIDLAVSGAALILLAPLFGAIALAIRLTSPGPIFFRQTRVGLGGTTFKIVKFRSMVTDAEARRPGLAGHSVYADQRLFKVKNDPRVTPLGALLRRTSLDELPQLWNVLRGEMSLVGPRPPLPSEVELYEEHHYARFDVKPGMTGPWQASGRNDITDFEQVIRLETEYIKDWTIWKDFAIILRTIPTVLKMRGAH